MEQLHTLFLDPEPLQRLFTYMCRSTTRDPIADTARIMLTTPVQFHISRHGVGLFQGCPVFPFTYMSKEQRQCMFDLLSAMGGDQMHSALQDMEAPLEYTAENERIFFKTPPLDRQPPDGPLRAFYVPCPTLSSSSSIHTSAATTTTTTTTASQARKPLPARAAGLSSAQAHRLDPRRVFDALLGAVADSATAYPDRLRLLLNLLLQRIGCQVHIDRDLLAHIQREMDRRLGPAPATRSA